MGEAQHYLNRVWNVDLKCFSIFIEASRVCQRIMETEIQGLLYGLAVIRTVLWASTQFGDTEQQKSNRP